MPKLILAITYLMFINLLGNAQNVYFTLSNSAKFLKPNTTDTLKNPFVGGFQKPQFNKIDLNNDGIKDLVVFDGVGNKVFTYLWENNNWVYAPSYEKDFPKLSQWLKLVDYNCDGKEDVFTASGPNFALEPNEFVRYNSIRYHQNTSTGNSNKFEQKVSCIKHVYEGFEDCVEFTQTDVGVIQDLNNDGKVDILYSPSSSNSFNLYQNTKPNGSNYCDSISFALKTMGWGSFAYKINSHGFFLNQPAFQLFKGNKHVSNAFAAYDLDADGDQDFLFGDGAFSTIIMLKNGKELSPQGNDSMIVEDSIFPRNTYRPLDLFWPSTYINDFDNDGVNDLIITTNEPVAVKNTNHVNFYKNMAISNNVPVDFKFVKENFLLEEMIDLGGNSKPVFVDIDNDDDYDIVVATQGNYLSTLNNYDLLYLYKNIGSKTNPVYSLVDTNFADIQANVRLALSNVTPTFGDLNGDGKKDMILGWFNGYLNYYQNTSNGNVLTFEKKDSNYFNINAGTQVAPQLVDLNKDGKLDIVIGKYNGTLAYFENTGTVTNPIFSSVPTIDSLGKINVRSREDTYGNATPYLFDLDNDGIFEALVGSYNKGVVLYTDITSNKNIAAKRVANIFKDDANMNPDSIGQGIYTTVSIANIDSDSLPEVLIGNQRGGFRFYKSTILGKISASVNDEAMNNTVDFKVFPNPAKNTLTVETKIMHEKAQVSIINIVGNTQIVKNFEKGTSQILLDISSIAPGIYFVKFETESGKQNVKRVVISE